MAEGIDLAKDMSGNVHINSLFCPYCGKVSLTREEAEAHDGECEKHPLAQKLSAAESRAAEFEAQAKSAQQTVALYRELMQERRDRMAAEIEAVDAMLRGKAVAK
jgi:uncharacterized Zn finger protein (UPF0148 family)